MAWQQHGAERLFGALIRRAVEEGPQIRSLHGKAMAVILGIEEYERLRHPRVDFAQFLLQGPDFEELEITRDRTPTRVVAL